MSNVVGKADWRGKLYSSVRNQRDLVTKPVHLSGSDS
jgi:hypothetical protein